MILGFTSPYHLLSYLKKSESTSEMTKGILILGERRYTPAIPFITEKLKWSQRWLFKYQSHIRAKGISEVISLQRAAEDALKNLELKIEESK